MDNSESKVLKIQIYQKLSWLTQQRHKLSVYWIPSQIGPERNEKADKAAKKAAIGDRIGTAK